MSDVLNVSVNDRISVVTMTRPGKRNAMNETLFSALEAFFRAPPEGVRVVILTGTEGHFCAGLDLAEHETRTAEENLHHSRRWHRLMDQIQLGGLIVVSAMFGAVIGGGLELASPTHVRIDGCQHAHVPHSGYAWRLAVGSGFSWIGNDLSLGSRKHCAGSSGPRAVGGGRSGSSHHCLLRL